MIELRSSLLAIAGRFTHKYEPYQAISVEPGPGGSGVLVFASDRGAASFVGYDGRGTFDEPSRRVKILPTRELIDACRGIKTAERRVAITGERAVVSSYGKTTTSVKEVPVGYSCLKCLSARDACLAAARRRAAGEGAPTRLLGRYDVALVRNAIRVLEEHGAPVMLSVGYGALPDGSDAPLRIYSESLDALAIVMPQKKKGEPYPPMPDWIAHTARTPVMADSPLAPSPETPTA